MLMTILGYVFIGLILLIVGCLFGSGLMIYWMMKDGVHVDYQNGHFIVWRG